MTKKEIRAFVNGNAINGKAVVERVITNARSGKYRPTTMAFALVDMAVKAA